MINIIMPPKDNILDMQRREGAFYWSSFAEMIFKKHGLETRKRASIDSNYNVFLRGIEHHISGSGTYEGPLDEKTLSDLALKCDSVNLNKLELYDNTKKSLTTVFYGRFAVKKIPESFGEETKQYEYIDPDQRWNPHGVHVQYFEPLSSDWEVVAYGRIDNQLKPVIIANREMIILGLPLLDIMAFAHIMPPLNVGFYTTLESNNLYSLERWFINQIINHAKASGNHIKCKNVWPNTYQSAFSIRHDYDRPISDEQLKEILRFYAENGIRSTWFLITEKPPPSAQINAIIALGHEVALHSVASTLEEFIEETIKFRELTGLVPLGYTCHGGIGSAGHLALTHNRWAMKTGMQYGELIGKCRGLPHPLVNIDNDMPVVERIMVQNCHFSLDLTTRPDGHQLEKLKNEIPKALADGIHIILMNHPDIHWAELKELLNHLDLSNTWCATIATVNEWLKSNIYAL